MSQPYDLIVIGGGISGLTAAYRAQQRGWRVLLLEAGERLGGSLETERNQGTLQELGAESMVAAKPWGRELCHELGLGQELVTPQAEFRRTLIVRGGRLHPIPEGLRLLAPSQWLPFLRSPAVSWPGKLRMALEFLVPRRKAQSDESLADFVRRRLGREALERIAQPLVAGIYTADPATLSMQATLPQFLEYERLYGSVCRGLLTSPEARASSGPRYQLFCSLQGGFQQLVDRLVERLQPSEIRLRASVNRIQPGSEGEGWRVDEAVARHLVLALPTYAARPLVQAWDGALADAFAELNYLSSATVNLVYGLEGLDRATRAFGFVVPAVEGSDILACTFSHRKYPGRTTPDVALLRTYVGGANRPEALDWSDEEMVERSRLALSGFLGVPLGALLHWRVKRYVKAMPLYRVGHRAWVERVEGLARKWPGLALAGNVYAGVGIPDCIHRANQVIAAFPE